MMLEGSRPIWGMGSTSPEPRAPAPPAADEVAQPQPGTEICGDRGMVALAALALSAAPPTASAKALIALLSASQPFLALIEDIAAREGSPQGGGETTVVGLDTPSPRSVGSAHGAELESSGARVLDASGISVLAREQLGGRAVRALARHARRNGGRRQALCTALAWWRARSLTGALLRWSGRAFARAAGRQDALEAVVHRRMRVRVSSLALPQSS